MPWGIWAGAGGLEPCVRRVLGVHGEVLESRGDANDFEIGDLFVPGLLMSQAPQRPGSGAGQPTLSKQATRLVRVEEGVA